MIAERKLSSKCNSYVQGSAKHNASTQHSSPALHAGRRRERAHKQHSVGKRRDSQRRAIRISTPTNGAAILSYKNARIRRQTAPEWRRQLLKKPESDRCSAGPPSEQTPEIVWDSIM